MIRAVALMLAIGTASPVLVAQTADTGRAASASHASVRRSVEQLKAARVQAESARAAAARDVARAEAAQESLEVAGRASAVRSVAPATGAFARRELAVDVGAAVVVLMLLVLLWMALGRAGARQWLAQRHGAQVLLLWGALLVYTLVSCASTAADIFSTHPGPDFPLAQLAVAWLSLVIITWRWASARGAATRTR
jgi:hypothetical protein